MRYNHILLSVLIFTSFFATGQNQIKVTSDFPGGNIVVSRIEGDTVWLEPNLSFTQGKWFYWYFKVSGISGKTVRFQFNENNLFAKYGPAYSINNDETWKWYGENRVENNSFTYTFSPQDTVAYFSVAFPYTEKNLSTFLGNLRNKEALMIDTLCFSPGNRTVKKITI
ncbi:MAG: M14-type cytosolic carboxypeptidase, partial [Mariniphaga sp.]|nr:M14-type cytosolic carboxypeptidase [Mariniphaga sp.]